MTCARFTFYLGTHEPQWLACHPDPLFISHRRLARRARLPRALGRWALDSGGFTELRLHGEWRTTVAEYVAATRRYSREIGRLEIAFAMDWMCDPSTVARTGLSVEEHQRRTVANLLELRALAPDLPFAPVLQGWHPEDYVRCATFYRDAGVELSLERSVGVGSVAGRRSFSPVRSIFTSLRAQGITLHAFGVKGELLLSCLDLLSSADSMAWSREARFAAPLPGCRHRRCSNCLRYAVQWREDLLDKRAVCTPRRMLSPTAPAR